MTKQKRFFSGTGITLLIGLTLSSMARSSSVEIEPEGEFVDIIKVEQMISQSVIDGNKKDGHAFRDAHRKHHGCVQATFTVQDGLPAELRQGIFAEPKQYSAWIRYSNGSGASQDDHVGDGRGMAVKIMGVEGPKVLEEERNELTQDFLMINHPVFFVRNASDYVQFQEAASSGQVLSFFLSLWHPTRAFHEFKIANDIRGKDVKNPLDSRYWSMTPYSLGDKQIKFSSKPCTSSFVSPSDSNDRLGENLTAHLEHQAACFDFMVQERTRDENEMPIEDPTIEWSEVDAPFVKVARIKIAPQKPEQGEFCETLSFTPWHSLEAHRPLGGINRVRKEVYRAISKLRHELNDQVRSEP